MKSTNAAAARAAAVLVANNVDGPLDQATLGDATGVLPTAGLSKADGDALAGRPGAPVTLTLATTIEERASRNVIAQTTTGNPDNVVMAGAHLDSVPEGPGINDNGSGTAALLETAVRLGGAPAVANAVRFAFWGAEEEGLIGSTRYVAGLSDADRQKISLYLNLDMVGSPNAAYLAYDGDNSDNEGAGPGPEGSATVERVLLEQLAATGVTGEGTDFDGRSDYGPFIDAGIPAGGLFTGAEEIKTARAGAALGRHGGPAVRPLLPPGVRPHGRDRPDGAGPQHRRRGRHDRPLRALHRGRSGLSGRCPVQQRPADSRDGGLVVGTRHLPPAGPGEQQERGAVRAEHLQPASHHASRCPPPLHDRPRPGPAAHLHGRPVVDGERVRGCGEQVRAGEVHRLPRGVAQVGAAAGPGARRPGTARAAARATAVAAPAPRLRRGPRRRGRVPAPPPAAGLRAPRSSPQGTSRTCSAGSRPPTEHRGDHRLRPQQRLHPHQRPPGPLVGLPDVAPQPELQRPCGDRLLRHQPQPATAPGSPALVPRDGSARRRAASAPGRRCRTG